MPVLVESASNVVGIEDGEPLHGPLAPDPFVIQELEELLEGARSGDIVGIAYTTEHHTGVTRMRYCGVVSRRMLGSLHCMAHKLVMELSS